MSRRPDYFKISIAALIFVVIIIFLIFAFRGFCPPWKKYVKTELTKQCYSPLEDTDKTCFQSSDCLSKQCIVDKNNTILKSCDKRENTKIRCPGISGNCTDGGPVSGIFILGKDNIVINNG